jgi:mono/diheme cytochrome c family protein
MMIFAAVGDGQWRAKVPDSARVRANPMAGDLDAVTAGAKLFQQNCASCHGRQAEGQAKHPNLHSDRMREAKPGELEWLLRNGSLKNGMPSWSRLPEQQRWQLVSFLKSL